MPTASTNKECKMYRSFLSFTAKITLKYYVIGIVMVDILTLRA